MAGRKSPLFVLLAVLLLALALGPVGCSFGAKKEQRDAGKLAAAKKDYEAGRFAKSEKTLNEVLESSPDNLEAMQTLALAQAAQGKNKQAVETYKDIVAKTPKDDASWYRMALLERILGQSKESDAHLQKAVELDPKNRSYIDELARTKMSIGQYKEAATLWGRLIQQKDIPADSKKELLILQGQAYQAAKDYGNAEKSYRAALKLDPDDDALRERVKSFD